MNATEVAASVAVHDQNLEELESLLNANDPEELIPTIVYAAVQGNNTMVLSWLLHQNLVPFLDILDAILDNLSVPTIQWAIQNGASKEQISRFFLDACTFGLLEIVVYIVKSYRQILNQLPPDSTISTIYRGVETAIIQGEIPILNWLLNFGLVDAEISDRWDDLYLWMGRTAVDANVRSSLNFLLSHPDPSVSQRLSLLNHLFSLPQARTSGEIYILLLQYSVFHGIDINQWALQLAAENRIDSMSSEIHRAFYEASKMNSDAIYTLLVLAGPILESEHVRASWESIDIFDSSLSRGLNILASTTTDIPIWILYSYLGSSKYYFAYADTLDFAIDHNNSALISYLLEHPENITRNQHWKFKLRLAQKASTEEMLHWLLFTQFEGEHEWYKLFAAALSTLVETGNPDLVYTLMDRSDRLTLRELRIILASMMEPAIQNGDGLITVQILLNYARRVDLELFLELFRAAIEIAVSENPAGVGFLIAQYTENVEPELRIPPERIPAEFQTWVNLAADANSEAILFLQTFGGTRGISWSIPEAIAHAADHKHFKIARHLAAGYPKLDLISYAYEHQNTDILQAVFKCSEIDSELDTISLPPVKEWVISWMGQTCSRKLDRRIRILLHQPKLTSEDWDTIGLLIEGGADLISVTERAVRYRHFELVPLLMAAYPARKGSILNAAMIVATERKDIFVLPKLLQLGVNIYDLLQRIGVVGDSKLIQAGIDLASDSTAPYFISNPDDRLGPIMMGNLSKISEATLTSWLENGGSRLASWGLLGTKGLGFAPRRNSEARISQLLQSGGTFQEGIEIAAMLENVQLFRYGIHQFHMMEGINDAFEDMRMAVRVATIQNKFSFLQRILNVASSVLFPEKYIALIREGMEIAISASNWTLLAQILSIIPLQNLMSTIAPIFEQAVNQGNEGAIDTILAYSGFSKADREELNSRMSDNA